MILGFKTIWPDNMGEYAGKPTRFPEKIINSFRNNEQSNQAVPGLGGHTWECHVMKFPPTYTIEPSITLKKIHTIREDPTGRWKAGNKIHFAIGVRTKNYFQFAPVTECVSVQEIEIKYGDGVAIFVDGEPIYWGDIKGQYYFYGLYKLSRLALNDGFDDINQFFAWFDKPFKGKIIHWTNYRYL